MRPAKKRLWAFLFAAYALVMLWLLYGQRARIVFPSAGAYYGDYLLRLRQTYNLVPFKTVVSFIRLLTASRSAYLVRHAFVNLAGNIVLFVIIALVGNALNLALNLLGCYVHDLRLQCLEYFGKFYEDGGKPFKPLMADTKYVDITK